MLAHTSTPELIAEWIAYSKIGFPQKCLILLLGILLLPLLAGITARQLSVEPDITTVIIELQQLSLRSLLVYCGLGRDRTGDLTIFSRSLVPTELPSQTRFQCHSPKKAYDTKTCAARIGLEPATSAVTGPRVN